MRVVLLMPSDEAPVWENALNVWGFQTLHTELSDSATRELLSPEAAPEIGVLDHRCFGRDGTSRFNNLETTLHQLRSGIASAHQYLIVLTPDNEAQLLLLNAGADVVVTLPVTAATLRVHLEVARRMLSVQVRERDQREREWEAQNQDYLSGTLNKTAILRKLEQLSVQCQDRNQSIGLLLAQIYVAEESETPVTAERVSADQFHPTLQRAARNITSCLRSADVLGRFDRDVFLVIVPDCGEEELLRVADRIRSHFQRSYASISWTIGVDIRWNERNSVADTVSRANRALTVANEMGRDRVVAAWSL